MIDWFDAKFVAQDRAYWERYFPGGVGPSVFSAPAWQSLMARAETKVFKPCFLRITRTSQPLTIPVFARPVSFGRRELVVRPIAYYVTPIEQARLSREDLDLVLRAICTPRICNFTWWLAPWSCDVSSLKGVDSPLGRLTIGSVDTYLMSRKERSAAEYVAREVSTTHQRYARVNDKRGVTVSTDVTPAARDAYLDIYRRAYEGLGWVGEVFQEKFFEGVATSLQRGGELAVVSVNDTVIGGGVLLYDQHAVHYFQGAIDRDVQGVHPHVALYRYALEQAEKRGLDIVNLGGVNDGNAGLIRFKESWGAKATPVPIVSWQSGQSHVVRSFRSRLPESLRGR